MLVNVKAEHIARSIARGGRASCTNCPIALAVIDAIDGVEDISVSKCVGVRVYLGGHRVKRYDLPYLAQDFIDKFDNRLEVEPFSFEMNEKPEYTTED